MKKLIALMMAVCLIGKAMPINKAPTMQTVTAVAAESTSLTYGNFEIFVYDDYISIKKYNGDESVVEVPGEINGLPVTDIYRDAFSNCESIDAVILPDTIRSIGNSAFRGCKNMESINLPDSITRIDDFVFKDCLSLTKAIFPANLESTGYAMYQGCTNITEIIFNSNIRTIESRTFENCISLKEATIPEGVKTIGKYSFCGCTSLEKINIPDSVEVLEGFAFDETPWLNKKKSEGSLIIENGVLIDGDESLSEIVIPDGVRIIADYALCQCYNLYSLSMPDSVVSIGYRALSLCPVLETVRFSENLESIGGMVFCEANLEEVNIPKKVKFIGDLAFKETPWFQKKIEETNIIIINDMIFYGRDLRGFLVIPDNIKYICPRAFYGTNISEIVFPDGIEVIGEDSFGQCQYLRDVTIPASIKVLNELAFSSSSQNLKMTVLNPDCEIVNTQIVPGMFPIGNGPFKGIVCGYEGSTAQAFAERKGLKFESLGEAPVTTAPPPTTATTSISTISTSTAPTTKKSTSYTTATTFSNTTNMKPNLTTYTKTTTSKSTSAVSASGVSGDANNDGVVSIADAVILQRWFLGSGELPCRENADISKDGRIDVFDMIEIRKILTQVLFW